MIFSRKYLKKWGYFKSFSSQTIFEKIAGVHPIPTLLQQWGRAKKSLCPLLGRWNYGVHGRHASYA